MIVCSGDSPFRRNGSMRPLGPPSQPRQPQVTPEAGNCAGLQPTHLVSKQRFQFWVPHSSMGQSENTVSIPSATGPCRVRRYATAGEDSNVSWQGIPVDDSSHAHAFYLTCRSPANAVPNMLWVSFYYSILGLASCRFATVTVNLHTVGQKHLQEARLCHCQFLSDGVLA